MFKDSAANLNTVTDFLPQTSIPMLAKWKPPVIPEIHPLVKSKSEVSSETQRAGGNCRCWNLEHFLPYPYNRGNFTFPSYPTNRQRVILRDIREKVHTAHDWTRVAGEDRQWLY